jgi:hypothetical protein
LSAVVQYQNTPAQQLWAYARYAPYDKIVPIYVDFWNDPLTTDRDRAEMGRLDRYFLLLFLLNRRDVLHPWLYEPCREVEIERYGYLDLWARFHYKSSFITFAGSIQEILEDPNCSIAIFSLKKDTAVPFLRQIKTELEVNRNLQQLYPDIFYENPQAESPKWSERDGIQVRRTEGTGTTKEPTVTAWGLIDGLPTGGHFTHRIYDDIVTEKSVGTPDAIRKTTERLELSYSLGTHGENDREQYIGTRYKFGDTYQELERRGVVKVRKYPATDNGQVDGNPVLMTQARWEDLKSKTGMSTLACQQLQNPLQGTHQSFDTAWLNYYEIRPLTLNVYIIADPARTKRKTSDKTGIAVIGVDYSQNKYLLDGCCHRLSLSERWMKIKTLRSKWMRSPGVMQVKVGYEQYGAGADFEYFREKMDMPSEPTFIIEELTWKRDAPDSYVDRVQRLEPDFREGRFFLPYFIHEKGKYLQTKLQAETVKNGSGHLVSKPILNIDEEGTRYELSERMVMEEYIFFPQIHVDFMDAMSRIYDMKPTPPIKRSPKDYIPEPEEQF